MTFQNVVMLDPEGWPGNLKSCLMFIQVCESLLKPWLYYYRIALQFSKIWDSTELGISSMGTKRSLSLSLTRSSWPHWVWMSLCPRINQKSPLHPPPHSFKFSVFRFPQGKIQIKKVLNYRASNPMSLSVLRKHSGEFLWQVSSTQWWDGHKKEVNKPP